MGWSFFFYADSPVTFEVLRCFCSSHAWNVRTPIPPGGTPDCGRDDRLKKMAYRDE